MASILAIDAGNSRIKWGLYEEEWRCLGSTDNRDIETLNQAWESIQTPQKIVVSNVAGEDLGARLGKLISRWQVSPNWVKAKKSQCGVTNAYANPEQLGSDRWAALIAAWTLSHHATLIVSLGTAMTVDVLSSQGRFEGGVIVPGAELMRRALVENTANLDPREGKFTDLPDNTADAITTGAIVALCGAIENVAKTAEQKFANSLSCILSGGDARKISGFLARPNRVIDNLVLEGLIHIANLKE